MKSYEEFNQELDEIFGFGRRGKRDKARESHSERQKKEREEKLAYMKSQEEKKKKKGGYEVISGKDAAPEHNVYYVHPYKEKEGKSILIKKGQRGV